MSTEVSERASDCEQAKRDYPRWQQIRLEHLSYAINLLLAFAGATMGFEITTGLDRSVAMFGTERSVLLISSMLLALSILCGLIATVTRLLDFRYTARTVRLRSLENEHDCEVSILRIKTKALGNATWCLFYGQIGTFGLGVSAATALYFMLIFSAG